MRRLIIALIILVVLGGAFFFSKLKSEPSISQLPSPASQQGKVDITASFTIITGNITRSFEAEKYHNKSPDVYIESSDPTIVRVTKAGITMIRF